MSDDRRAVLERLLAEMKAEFPSFRIVKKEHSRFAKAMDVALKIVTLGGQREFMTRYYTVIGDTLYVPAGFDDIDPIDVAVTLRHERVHLRQRRRYTMVPFAILYLFLPLPLGLAYGRARIEWEAYAETFRAVAEVFGPARAREPELRAHVVRQFTSPAYGWMWPFPRQVNAWIDEVLATLPAATPAP